MEKSSMAKSSPVENLLILFAGQLSTTCSNATEVAKCVTNAYS